MSIQRVLFTIGHSTRTLPELVGILRAFGVAAVADVRKMPRSRRLPHFNKESLETELPSYDIQYVPFPALGGLRRPRIDSANTGWRNDSFRGYADYMQTPQFERALEELIQLAGKTPTAIMCAEAVPWRCHRSLIGDAMVARGWQVVDLMGERSASVHKLTEFAQIDGDRVTYPAAEHDLGQAKLF
jgi:uncharacterized protein (DUF488 family)